MPMFEIRGKLTTFASKSSENEKNYDQIHT